MVSKGTSGKAGDTGEVSHSDLQFSMACQIPNFRYQLLDAQEFNLNLPRTKNSFVQNRAELSA
jgi:hypothetical protein